MILIHILLTAIAIWGLLQLIVKIWRGIRIWRNIKASFSNAATSHNQQAKGPEQMQQCSTCNMYIPTTEAINSKGLYFCCKQHEREYKD